MPKTKTIWNEFFFSVYEEKRKKTAFYFEKKNGGKGGREEAYEAISYEYDIDFLLKCRKSFFFSLILNFSLVFKTDINNINESEKKKSIFIAIRFFIIFLK